jgi:glycosyltransferase involved in cell wall biosynthesis
MPENVGNERPVLLVLASTYPRWAGDHEPGFVHELARRLVDVFDVVAVVPSSPGSAHREILDGVKIVRYRYAPRRLETLVSDGGIVVNLRRRPWKWLLVPAFCIGQLIAAWRVIRDTRPVALHAHWLIPQGVVAAVLRTLSAKTPPFVVTSHGADLFALRGRLFGAIRKFVVRRADAVTVVSKAMRDSLEEADVDVHAVSVQPMGIDLRNRFRADPALPRSKNEILFVGRLVEKKGLKYLIDAMPRILAGHPDAFLTVAGFGPEEGSLRAQATALGLDQHIRFLGAVPQISLPDLYRRAALFVAPFVRARSGDQEGFGLVLVEALGCGCPVVASELPATREVLSDFGGVTRVPPGDRDALAQAVEAALSDPVARAARAMADRERLVERYDWATVAARYAATLRGE